MPCTPQVPHGPSSHVVAGRLSADRWSQAVIGNSRLFKIAIEITSPHSSMSAFVACEKADLCLLKKSFGVHVCEARLVFRGDEGRVDGVKQSQRVQTSCA